jgi:hypothetical protein
MYGRAETEKTESARVLCKQYEGKALFSGMLHLYVGIRLEKNEFLLWKDAKSNHEFSEQRRCK